MFCERDFQNAMRKIAQGRLTCRIKEWINQSIDKTMYSYVGYKKTWTWLRKGNVKRETDSPQFAAQNNGKRINYR